MRLLGSNIDFYDASLIMDLYVPKKYRSYVYHD